MRRACWCSPVDTGRCCARPATAFSTGTSRAATPYDVLKPQVVEERLVRAGLGDPRVAAAKDASELAKILGVDGIVYGELTHWDRVFVGIYAQVSSGAHIRLVNARTGQTLFERNEVRRSQTGSLPG